MVKQKFPGSIVSNEFVDDGDVSKVEEMFLLPRRL